MSEKLLEKLLSEQIYLQDVEKWLFEQVIKKIVQENVPTCF